MTPPGASKTAAPTASFVLKPNVGWLGRWQEIPQGNLYFNNAGTGLALGVSNSRSSNLFLDTELSVQHFPEFLGSNNLSGNIKNNYFMTSLSWRLGGGNNGFGAYVVGQGYTLSDKSFSLFGTAGTGLGFYFGRRLAFLEFPLFLNGGWKGRPLESGPYVDGALYGATFSVDVMPLLFSPPAIGSETPSTSSKLMGVFRPAVSFLTGELGPRDSRSVPIEHNFTLVGLGFYAGLSTPVESLFLWETDVGLFADTGGSVVKQSREPQTAEPNEKSTGWHADWIMKVGIGGADVISGLYVFTRWTYLRTPNGDVGFGVFPPAGMGMYLGRKRQAAIEFSYGWTGSMGGGTGRATGFTLSFALPSFSSEKSSPPPPPPPASTGLELGEIDLSGTSPKNEPFELEEIVIEGDPSSVSIANRPEGGREIRVDGEVVYFDFDSSVILPHAYPILNKVAEIIRKDLENKTIRIQGHADEKGTEEYNLELSKNRALAVRKYLGGRGIDETRLKIDYFGKSRPAEKGDSKEAQAKNRRVQFIIEN